MSTVWNNDTIAAVASPFGEGAIALLRVSGPAAVAVADRVCDPARRLPSTLAPKRQHLARLLAPGTDRTLDEVLVSVHRAPASYTGEDLVEFTCHGGILLTRRVLEALLVAGARPAEPGEFTQRAFLNGKMDLTQAEGVMDLITAQTDLALRSATEQLAGRLGERVSALREELLGLTAHVEAYIDFPDEDIDPDTGAALLARLDGAARDIQALLDTADQGRILREGVRTVIYGEPNVGKSSLLNALLGSERAIVSEIPGTTRDTIEERLDVRGLPLRLIDTAGLRASEDPLENAGMARTRATLDRADLALRVVDGSRPPPTEDLREGEDSTGPRAATTLLILNKADLGLDAAWAGRADGIAVSCRAHTGLDRLGEAIYERVTSGQVAWSDATAAINARHQDCLRRAGAALGGARGALAGGLSAEYVALDLRGALEAVGEVVGAVDTDEILGKIFASFCIGK